METVGNGRALVPPAGPLQRSASQWTVGPSVGGAYLFSGETGVPDLYVK